MNLDQVTIYTEKPIETVEFFQKLGLSIIVDSMPRYARLLCPDGDSTLSVHIGNAVSPNPGIVLYFECDDLDQTVLGLKKKGLTFEQEPRDESWFWCEAYLRDPNGNRICLFHAGENRQNPPWRVN